MDKSTTVGFFLSQPQGMYDMLRNCKKTKFHDINYIFPDRSEGINFYVNEIGFYCFVCIDGLAVSMAYGHPTICPEGLICFKLEYATLPDYRRKDLARVAVTAVCVLSKDFFESSDKHKSIDLFEAHIEPDNLESQAFANKMGMHRNREYVSVTGNLFYVYAGDTSFVMSD